MRLKPAEPPQEVIDALILEAAWERAKQCEDELRSARAIIRSNRKAFDAWAARLHGLRTGIGGLMTKLRGNPDMSIGQVISLLGQLLEDNE